MFDTQINGGEVETCEATVGGVPYNDGLNQAGKVLAGLDIINAIQRNFGIMAPIIIDGAESINSIPEMDCQMILLRVTEDEKLTVK